MKYWHKISDDEYKRLIKSKTWKYATENYRQPPWCSFPDALEGLLGCNSLVFDREKICREFCKSCEYFKNSGVSNG